MPAIQLTRREVQVLLDALDSHEYWQLSDPAYRWSGFVMEDGADDVDAREGIAEVRRLVERLERATTPPTARGGGHSKKLGDLTPGAASRNARKGPRASRAPASR